MLAQLFEFVRQIHRPCPPHLLYYKLQYQCQDLWVF